MEAFDIIFGIFGLLFAGVGTYFVIQSGMGIVRSLGSRNWSTTEGTITASDVRVDMNSSSRATYIPEVTYEYEVRGTLYTGDNINFSKFHTSDPTGASRTTRKYPVGEQVTVFHHPWQPEKSALEQGRISPLIPGLIVGVAVATFGTLFALSAFVGLDGVMDAIGTTIAPDADFVWNIILPLVMVAGLFVMGYGIRTIFYARATRKWPTVEGIVLGSGIVRSMSSSSSRNSTITNQYTYKAEIAYEYEVDGQRYVSNRVHLLDIATSNPGRAQLIQSRYKEGRPVRVYYQPDNPEQALLEPGGSSGAWLPILVGAGFFIIGLIVKGFHAIVTGP